MDMAEKQIKTTTEKSFLESAQDMLSKIVKTNPASNAAADERTRKKIDEIQKEDIPTTTDKSSSSYKQFLHEKSVGGPSTDNYEAWKKLG
jgi:hypothetical protein